MPINKVVHIFSHKQMFIRPATHFGLSQCTDIDNSCVILKLNIFIVLSVNSLRIEKSDAVIARVHTVSFRD